MKWYECNLITDQGKKDFWCRFIANSQDDAKHKIKLNYSQTKLMFSKYENKIIDKKVAALSIKPVPQKILNRYDLNKRKDYESFLKRERG